MRKKKKTEAKAWNTTALGGEFRPVAESQIVGFGMLTWEVCSEWMDGNGGWGFQGGCCQLKDAYIYKACCFERHPVQLLCLVDICMWAINYISYRFVYMYMI